MPIWLGEAIIKGEFGGRELALSGSESKRKGGGKEGSGRNKYSGLEDVLGGKLASRGGFPGARQR